MGEVYDVMGDMISQEESDALLETPEDREGDIDPLIDDYEKQRKTAANRIWMMMDEFPYEIEDEKLKDVFTLIAFIFNSLGSTQDEIAFLPEHLQQCFHPIPSKEKA